MSDTFETIFAEDKTRKFPRCWIPMPDGRYCSTVYAQCKGCGEIIKILKNDCYIEITKNGKHIPWRCSKCGSEEYEVLQDDWDPDRIEAFNKAIDEEVSSYPPELLKQMEDDE